MRLWPFLAPLALIFCGATAGRNTVEMKLKYSAGQVSRMTISLVADDTNSTDSAPAEQRKIKMTAELQHRVVKLDKSGTTVELTFNRLEISETTSVLDVAFDSAKDKPDGANPLGGLRTMIGKTLTVHFTPEGKAEQIDGFENIAKEILQQRQGELAADIAEQLLGPEQFRLTFNRSQLAAIPSKPVDVGDKWESTFVQEAGAFTIHRTGHYKLASVIERDGHKIANIEFTSDGVVKVKSADGAILDFGKEREKGIKQFDLTAGSFVHTDRELTLEGEMKVPPPNGNGTSQLKRVVKSKVTLVPAEKQAERETRP